MHANKAHPFLKGGYPLVTIKYSHIYRVAPLALTDASTP